MAVCCTPVLLLERNCTVATGYGGWGTTIRSVEDLKPALEDARRIATATPGVSALLNALIGNTNFREGSLSV